MCVAWSTICYTGALSMYIKLIYTFALNRVFLARIVKRYRLGAVPLF